MHLFIHMFETDADRPARSVHIGADQRVLCVRRFQAGAHRANQTPAEAVRSGQREDRPDRERGLSRLREHWHYQFQRPSTLTDAGYKRKDMLVLTCLITKWFSIVLKEFKLFFFRR